MVKFLKEYWFGILMFALVGLFLLFAIVVELAPHNDAKMRGFTPCTYEMGANLLESQNDLKDVVLIVSEGYMCYFGVMVQGVVDWSTGKQKTPWANYWFEEHTFEADEDDVYIEPFSEDLLKANRLN